MKRIFHLRTGHEDPKREQRYSSTLSLTSAPLGGRWWTPRPCGFYPRDREPVPVLQEAGWAPRSVWTGAENLAPTGIRSPDCPARTGNKQGLINKGSVRGTALCNKPNTAPFISRARAVKLHLFQRLWEKGRELPR